MNNEEERDEEEKDDETISLIVAGDLSKNRLDQYLADNVETLSRARVQKLIEDGLVQVNGIVQRASFRLKDGDGIKVVMPPPAVLEALAENIYLKVIYEDEHLVVIDKPAGMVTHPGAGVSSGTLVNAVLYHCAGSLSSIGGVIRPGIVHRLDKDTTGLIVVAKTDLAHSGLSAQLKVKSARRSYLAICQGDLKADNGTVDTYIGRHPVRRKEMAVLKEDQGGRRAVTHWSIEGRYSKFLKVALELETGRTHQIRVHMAYLNAPVAGDVVYNKKSSGDIEWRRKQSLKGHALHAYKLAFSHPATGLLLEFVAPPPPDFEQLVARLK
jgi:23S rRNA pseudouridine1911/1915/1917 synthase